jgi:hypothetical protein
MSKQSFPEEFKTEAVKQITERGHKVSEVTVRLGVNQHISTQRFPAQVLTSEGQTSEYSGVCWCGSRGIPQHRLNSLILQDIQVFQGACPAAHRPSRYCLSRTVSIGCQNPLCMYA